MVAFVVLLALTFFSSTYCTSPPVEPHTYFYENTAVNDDEIYWYLKRRVSDEIWDQWRNKFGSYPEYGNYPDFIVKWAAKEKKLNETGINYLLIILIIIKFYFI